MMFSHLDLALIHTDVLYMHDPNNRLLRINEPDPGDLAPRFFLFRTTSGNLWRTRYDLSADVAARLAKLAADEPIAANLGELAEAPHHVSDYAELLRQPTPPSSPDIYSGPAYYLPEPHSNLPSHETVIITPSNVTLLEPSYPYTRSRYAELAPVVVRVVNGMAAAVCCSARVTAQAAEASVHTTESYTGRGFAFDVVRMWAAAIRSTSKLPLYSTSWENVASQAVAKKLGAVLYGVDFSIT